MELIIIETDIEGKKRGQIQDPVANWCRQLSFKQRGWIRFPAGSQRNILLWRNDSVPDS